MVQNNEEPFEILTNPVFDDLLNKHLKDDAKALALRYADKKDFPNLLPLWNLLDFYSKVAEKLPSFYKARCRMPRKAFEQASSEVTANWKSNHFLESNEVILNLCGGIGADDAAFSSKAEQIISLEIDAFTHACAKDAMVRLNLKNVKRVQQDAEVFIQGKLPDHISFIYADPDRRASGSRSFQAHLYSPNLKLFMPKLINKGVKVLLKLSPMEAWQESAKWFPHLSEVVALSLDDEVKELLVYYHPNQKTTILSSVNIRKDKDVQKFEVSRDTKVSEIIFAELPADYFYEVHPTIAKLNTAHFLLHQYGLQALTANAIFATAHHHSPKFFGRVFRVQHAFPYQRKKMNLYIKEQNLSQANVTKRDFRMEVHEIRKVHHLKDGGIDYFFFYQNKDRQPWVVHAKKLN